MAQDQPSASGVGQQAARSTGQGQRKAQQKGHNTLREAWRGTQTSKADEIWFRKCGYGEGLFLAYYRGQRLVPGEEWPAFLEART